MAITGGCLCGAVRFEIEADAPLGVRQCWRRVCQYLRAGSATVNAIFRTEALTRLCEQGRQRIDDAPAILRRMRHSPLQRGGAPPAWRGVGATFEIAPVVAGRETQAVVASFLDDEARPAADRKAEGGPSS